MNKRVRVRLGVGVQMGVLGCVWVYSLPVLLGDSDVMPHAVAVRVNVCL